MSFQFMPAAIFGLTIYLLAAIGAIGVAAHVITGTLRLFGVI